MVTIGDLWQPDTQYALGSVVVYDNARYKIIQPHTSQADWTPPVTPALWGRLQEDHPSDQGYHPGYIAPSEPRTYSQSNVPGYMALASAAGAAAGYRPPEHHPSLPPSGYEQGQPRGYDAWLADAQARAHVFRTSGPRAPTTWLLVDGEGAPAGAVPVPGAPDLRICRRYHDGQMWTAARFYDRVHEVLMGDVRALRWHAVRGRLEHDIVERERLVSAGTDDDGKHVYVGIGEHDREVVVGRSVAGQVLRVRQGDDVHELDEYRVLCYH